MARPESILSICYGRCPSRAPPHLRPGPSVAAPPSSPSGGASSEHGVSPSRAYAGGDPVNSPALILTICSRLSAIDSRSSTVTQTSEVQWELPAGYHRPPAHASRTQRLKANSVRSLLHTHSQVFLTPCRIYPVTSPQNQVVTRASSVSDTHPALVTNGFRLYRLGVS